MHRILITLIGFWLWAVPAVAQDPRAIHDTISSQLDAFHGRDLDRAWQYAAPNIKRIFGDAQNFGAMVERGYPMVWNNVDTTFLDIRDINGQLWQKVIVRDAAGGLHTLDYQMVATPDGWQIAAVQILIAPDIGA